MACFQQLNQWASFREVCHQSQNFLLQTIHTLNVEVDKFIEDKRVDEPECLKEKSENDDVNDDSYESFEPDVDNNSLKQETCSPTLILQNSEHSKRRAVRRKKVNKKKLSKSCIKVKRKSTRNCKKRINTNPYNDFDEDDTLDDTVEALEKYLLHLYQEDSVIFLYMDT